jgi:GNAT superfamily N-acetyltransferase
MQLFLARSGGKDVGRISAHIDELALAQPAEQGMGPGTGNWGMLEAEDEAVTHALITAAEEWLRGQGMTRVLAPISLSIWEEPGLLTFGHDHAPMVMMGHDNAAYQGWVESAGGYEVAKRLFTYDLDVSKSFPELINRIVAMGEKNKRITVRPVDKSQFAREAAIFIDILNEAWSNNWGFVPFSETEKAYGAKKLKPIILQDTNMIAELDGEPVAFMMALPDLNQKLKHMDGKLFPFNWAKLLWWLRNPQGAGFRVPLMGVVKKYQNSRMASQLAFMMIEYIRRNAVEKYGAKRGEVGWILDDNQGMIAIADAIEAKMNREYTIYSKSL